MGRKILQALVNNLGFKLLAVAFAFVLWLVVYNLNDPSITKTYKTTVSVVNADAISGMKKYFEIENNSNYVKFSVSAKRSVFKEISEGDFTATADMSNIIQADDGLSGTVRIDISCAHFNNSLNYGSKIYYLEVSLEDLMSKYFPIETATTGEVMKGYALGTVEVATPSSLKVSGPKSLVSMIESVKATIDVSGAYFNITDDVVPTLYDKKGKEIDTTKLKLGSSMVKVEAQILSTKSVPIELSTKGHPYGDNTVLGIDSSLTEVNIKGLPSALNQISSINVSPIDVTGAADDVAMTIDITEYLPDGVELVDPSEAKFTVVVRIKSYASKDYVVSTSNIEYEGLEEGYTLEFVASTFSIKVSGEENALSDIVASDIKGKIDVSDLEEGSHTLNVVINLDEDKFTWTTVKVEVVISKQEVSEPKDDEKTDDPDVTDEDVTDSEDDGDDVSDDEDAEE